MGIGETRKLRWWELSLLGVGSIIGTGYFLASGIAIRMTGPSIILTFILAAMSTYIVYEALAKMSAKNPEKGSFRTYALQAFGKWAGFGVGWVYWFSEMLICGSQLTALSLLTRFWFPNLALWIFTSIYAVLGIIVVIIGTRGFEKSQNLFAIIKLAAIFMFIVLGLLVLFGLFGGQRGDFTIPTTWDEFFPHQYIGLWSSLIYGFYAFGGIEIMGIMAPRLKNKNDIQKAGSFMLLLLTIIYLVSVSFATGLVDHDHYNAGKSPFMIALEKYSINFFPHLFTGGIIIAGFSTLAASLFAVTSMVETLALDGDAPKIFARKGKLKVPPFAFGLTVSGMILSIFMSFIMPNTVYEYTTTAASLMLLYIWVFILISYPRLLNVKRFSQVKNLVATGIMVLAISGTLFEKTTRYGFFVSILFVVFIGIIFLIRRFFKKKKEGEGQETAKGTLFVKLSSK